jgi:2,3-bisphosphoglycerate-dependent phosphoglycerate mutase
LYLIRHAQSQNNALPEEQRTEDPGITAAGRRQAALLADRFAGAPITHVLTSAFRRALETTQPLARGLGVPPVIWTDLHEIGGCYRGHLPTAREGRPGMGRRQLRAEFPDFEVPGDIDDEGWWKSRPYESTDQAMARARRQSDRLVEEFGHTDAVVACVIHADFKALMIKTILGNDCPPCDFSDLWNVGVTAFQFQQRQPRVELLNDVSHLPEELLTQ